jgi:aspartyl-tRNA(Asn)/glutamyl-tRNA(Gln) amidotransferase subunit A
MADEEAVLVDGADAGFLDAIEAGNRALNAYVLPTPSMRWRRRRTAMRDWPRSRPGRWRPAARIKDLYCTKGVRTTACSNILGEFTPTYESTVTQNLWDAGAVMLGKLNNDEFAMGSSNETSRFGPVVNPWRRKGSNVALVPGGSSGRSSSAVSADLCSGRRRPTPAARSASRGASPAPVGIKPTYGRCSRWGIVAFAVLARSGRPIARPVRDAAILLRTMASYDPRIPPPSRRRCPTTRASAGSRAAGSACRRNTAGACRRRSRSSGSRASPG